MKTTSQIIDGFEAFRNRRHKNKSEVTGADVRKLQEEYLRNHLLNYKKAGMVLGANIARQHGYIVGSTDIYLAILRASTEEKIP